MSRKYCKAYYIKELRKYQGWGEKIEGGEESLDDEEVVYVWDDFTVVKNPVLPDKGVLFDRITEEWKHFCTTELAFTIPKDLQYAYIHDEKQA